MQRSDTCPRTVNNDLHPRIRASTVRWT